jgi:type II secretion system protein G
MSAGSLPAGNSSPRARSWPLAAGFTLIELLVVIVILAILAAIVIPHFSDASDTAKISSMQSQIQVVRGQLELYHVHHNVYPPLDGFWTLLMSKTDRDGTINNVSGSFGPYLPQPPMNLFTKSTTIVQLGSATANDGWEYDPASGHLQAVGFNEATLTYSAPMAGTP